MLHNQSKNLTLFAIALILGTVAPVIVSAENSAVVTNSVYSSSHTGGDGQAGVAGEDGQDGEDGRNGADGGDGASGQPGASSASASITNHVSGSESHTVVISATSGNAVVEVDSTISVATDHSGEAEQSTLDISSPEVQERQLLSLLISLREALTAYVQKLF